MAWYKNEGERSSWNQLAKERGFASWADWRLQGYARRFECEKADWGFYEIVNPEKVVSEWLGGPFRTWIEKYYNGDKTKSFTELISCPEIASSTTINKIATDYPVDSIITALELADGRIFIIEGMHRSCALSLMNKNGQTIPGKLVFAIGKTKLVELPPVGENTYKK